MDVRNEGVTCPDAVRLHAPVRAAAGEYPSGWYNGYDFRRVMNDGSLYYVRAIPSLYLLDAGKRVIMKDAPTERVLAFLENAINS